MSTPLFPSWQGPTATLVTDGGEVEAGGDHSRRALLRALALGAQGAALSVRLTEDGVPVLFRRGRTGAVAREDLVVAESAAAVLESLLLKGGEPALFLEEALLLLPPALPILLVLLVPGAAAAVAPLLSPAGDGKVAVVSPLGGEITVAAEILPGVPRFLLAERPSLSDVAFCARHSIGISARGSALTPVRCGRLREDGVSFLAHGVETASLRDRAFSSSALALLTRHISRLMPSSSHR